MPSLECGFRDHPQGPGARLLMQFGPTLHVRIGFDEAHRTGAGLTPDLPEQLYPALVDTGAVESCVDARLAKTLQLPVVDRVHVAGVHGKGTVRMHLGQIFIPGLEMTIVGRFAGVHLQDGGQPHLALMGRTFLQGLTLTYDGKTGRVTICRE